LSEDEKDLLNRIPQAVNIFYTARNGNLVELNPEMINTFTTTTLAKYNTNEKLQEILNNI